MVVVSSCIYTLLWLSSTYVSDGAPSGFGLQIPPITDLEQE